MKEASKPSPISVSRAAAGAQGRALQRKQMLAQREALPASARVGADAAIALRLDCLVRRLAPASIGGYWPMRDEPELVDAFARWHAAGIVVALPRVVEVGAPLQFGRWAPGITLAHGPFGTRHPEPHDPVMPAMLVLPCVGFDQRCYRLGYGGGFYDRTLAAMGEVVTVGVGYDECELAGFEAQAHDQPLDWVVTQTRTLVRAR